MIQQGLRPALKPAGQSHARWTIKKTERMKMPKTTIKIALEKSEHWMVNCAEMIEGATFPTTNRLRVAISLLHLCLEHHQGIYVLVDQNVIGSAFALLRPQLETYVRGVWFHHCATEEQIEAFLKGNDPPRFGDLIEAIEHIKGFDCGTLTDIKKTAYRNLNDFTHGGATQVKARNSREEVVSSYLPEHVLGVIGSSTALSLLAAVAIAAAVDDNELGNRLLERYQEIYRT